MDLVYDTEQAAVQVMNLKFIHKITRGFMKIKIDYSKDSLLDEFSLRTLQRTIYDSW